MIFEQMQKSVAALMPQIFSHPFNVELGQGSLPQEKFIHYLQQDALYLADFARALSLTAARLTCSKQTNQFMEFALGAIRAEQELHLRYLQKYQAAEISHLEQSPSCFMYTNYLLRLASTSPVEEAVAGLLPCFWVYREVGNKICSNKSLNNLYDHWIEMYSSEEFNESVTAAISITNTLGEHASLALQNKMVSAFKRATQLEWCFWDSAYRLENWS